MNQTEQVFLSLLRGYVCGEVLQALPETNWQALYHLAQDHNVTGIFGRIFADLSKDGRPPAPYDSMFRQAMGQTLMAYEKKNGAVQVMARILDEEDIPYLTVKGAQTAAAYPDPSLRTSGDTDIVLTEENQIKAIAALESHGFAKKVAHEDVNLLTLYGWEFELHTRLESINDASKVLLQNPFDSAISYAVGRSEYALRPAYAVYYTVLHLLHHIKTGGAGVRMLLDTDLLLRQNPDAALQALDLAKTSHLERSFTCIFALCKQWLHTPIPCPIAALDAETADKFAAVILGGGVFGHGNGNTGAVFLARQKAAKGAATPFNRLGALLRYLFPNRAYMTYQFSYLEKKPYLLLFAYFQRFWIGLFRNRAHSVASFQALTGKNQGAAQLHSVWEELDI